MRKTQKLKQKRDFRKSKQLFADNYDDLKKLRHLFKLVNKLNCCCDQELSDTQFKWLATYANVFALKLPKHCLITEIDYKKSAYCVQRGVEKSISKLKKTEEAFIVTDTNYVYRYVPKQPSK